MADRTDRSPNAEPRPTRDEPRGDDRARFGGGMQPGGGMVEPDEFEEAIDSPELPNDAVAEGRTIREASARERDGSPVDPAAPDGNLTGDRVGDVTGYRGSDRVVGIDPSRRSRTSEPRPPSET